MLVFCLGFVFDLKKVLTWKLNNSTQITNSISQHAPWPTNTKQTNPGLAHIRQNMFYSLACTRTQSNLSHHLIHTHTHSFSVAETLESWIGFNHWTDSISKETKKILTNDASCDDDDDSPEVYAQNNPASLSNSFRWDHRFCISFIYCTLKGWSSFLVQSRSWPYVWSPWSTFFFSLHIHTSNHIRCNQNA